MENRIYRASLKYGDTPIPLHVLWSGAGEGKEDLERALLEARDAGEHEIVVRFNTTGKAIMCVLPLNYDKAPDDPTSHSE